MGGCCPRLVFIKSALSRFKEAIQDHQLIAFLGCFFFLNHIISQHGGTLPSSARGSEMHCGALCWCVLAPPPRLRPPALHPCRRAMDCLQHKLSLSSHPGLMGSSGVEHYSLGEQETRILINPQRLPFCEEVQVF